MLSLPKGRKEVVQEGIIIMYGFARYVYVWETYEYHSQRG